MDIREKLSRILWAIVPIIIGLISLFVLSKYFTSSEFTAPFIEAIDTECDNAIKLSAGASGLATAITVLPSDYGESLSDQLAIIGVCFVVVISLLTFGKYMLPVSAYAAFKIMIPIACVVLCLAILAGKGGFRQAAAKIGAKIIMFSLIIFIIVPATVGVTNIIKDTHNESIEASMSKCEEALDKVNGSTSGKITDWDSLTKAVKERVTGAITIVKEAVNMFIESLAVMLVTSCLTPLAVTVVLLLIGWTVLSTDIHTQSIVVPAKEAIFKKLLDEDKDTKEITLV